MQMKSELQDRFQHAPLKIYPLVALVMVQGALQRTPFMQCVRGVLILLTGIAMTGAAVVAVLFALILKLPNPSLNQTRTATAPRSRQSHSQGIFLQKDSSHSVLELNRPLSPLTVSMGKALTS